MSDPHTGWECPRCHIVRAPWVNHCNCVQAGAKIRTQLPVPEDYGDPCRGLHSQQPIETYTPNLQPQPCPIKVGGGQCFLQAGHRGECHVLEHRQ